MKAVTFDTATGNVREFNSEEEAFAYAKSHGYHAEVGGVFPTKAKEDVIAAAKAAVGSPVGEKKLNDYDRGVRDVCWALAHMFKDQGDHLVSLQAARYADFELLHSLADAIKTGYATGAGVVKAVQEQAE